MKFLFCLLVMLEAVSHAQERPKGGEDRRHGPPEGGAAWVDEASGFLVPQNLAGFVMEGWVEWNDTTLGRSVRLQHEKARARADIYAYACDVPAATDTDKRAAVEGELRKSVAVVYEMEKRGTYSDVDAQNGSFGEIDLLPDGSIPFAWSLVTMTIHQRTPAGDAPAEVTSWHAVTVFNKHFIKVRYTFPTEEKKAGEKVLNEFVEAWQWCLREPGFRAMIRPSLKTYLADPLGPKAAEAAGAVLTYAEKTSFISLEIGGRISACMQEAAAAQKGSELDIMRAFVTGCVEASLHSQKPAEMEAGAALAARVYGLLQEKHAGFQCAALDELRAAVKEKRAAKWLAEKGGGGKKP
ncbi:MAG: hypothetical protein JNG86_11645 [Verrucomicrobiaceae bacterium]|nr:hypothetical protein [Verrucomicrobiaceae bacterium]